MKLSYISATATPLRQPKQARSRKTRKKIMDAATELFETRGYEPATTSAIARRAGVSVGAFYLYFPNKHSVLMEIFHDSSNQIFSHAMEGLKPEHWQADDLRLGIRALIEGVLSSHGVRPGIQRILNERYLKDAEIRGEMDRLEAATLDAILSLMKHLRGRVRTGDQEAAAYILFRTVDVLSNRLALGISPIKRGRLIEELTEMIARYIVIRD